MILYGIIRTKEFGTKKRVQVDGYTEPNDLGPANRIVRTQYPYARAVLFLVPKQERKL